MVSDSELIARLHDFLRNSDLNTTTTAIVRRQLEKDFSVDLSDKKPFIREQVDLFLQSQFENAQEEDDDGGGVDDGDDQTAKLKSEQTEASDDDDDEEEEAVDNEEDGNGKRSGKRGSSTNPIQFL